MKHLGLKCAAMAFAFAASAQAFTLTGKVSDESGKAIEKASVELAKQWRSDKALRKLEAMFAVADRSKSFIITGNGDVVQPENDLISMGSGGDFARSAAIALLENTDLTAEEIANKALTIASNICVFTNSFKTVEIINY